MERVSVVEELEKALDDVGVAVAEIAVLVVPHHKGSDAVEDESIVGRLIF